MSENDLLKEIDFYSDLVRKLRSKNVTTNVSKPSFSNSFGRQRQLSKYGSYRNYEWPRTPKTTWKRSLSMFVKHSQTNSAVTSAAAATVPNTNRVWIKSTNVRKLQATVSRRKTVPKTVAVASTSNKYKICKVQKASVVAPATVAAVTTKRKQHNETKFRKVNIACPKYRKYGRCEQHERNKCRFKHDANQIRLCSRFLMGLCENVTDCKLSHNVRMEKMPTCKFFLREACINDKCPYLHLKVDSDANLCPDFLNGYCKAAEKCLKRHEEVQQKPDTRTRPKINKTETVCETCKPEAAATVANTETEKTLRYFELFEESSDNYDSDNDNDSDQRSISLPTTASDNQTNRNDVKNTLKLSSFIPFR